MRNTERTLFLVSVIVIGLALSLMINPASVAAPLVWLIPIVLVMMVCVGTDQIVHSHWRVHLRKKRYVLTLLILPALVTFGAYLFVRPPVFATGPAVVLGLGVTAFLLYAVITCQFHTIDPEDARYPFARFSLNLIGYLTAFSLFSAIYSSKMRSIVSATAILIISVLISLELLRGSERAVQRTWLYAAIVGIVMGQFTWALNYWVISGLAGGIFLLAMFYVLSGIVQNHLLEKLNPRLALEFGIVGAAGLALAMSSGLWLQVS